MISVKKIISIIGLIALLFFLANRIIFFKKGFLENITTSISYPFLRVSSFITEQAKKITKKKKSYKKLQIRYRELKKDYDALLEQIVSLQATIRHHKLSGELTTFKKRYKLEQAQLSKIVVKHFTDNEHYFLINRGSKHGIKQNMVAIYKLQIIGKIKQAYPYHSKITLITDKTCKIAAFTNTTNAQGISTGTNKINQFELCYINQLANIIQDDLVFSSGQGLVFPEGFCLGKISSHKHNKKELYHHITLTPIVDLTKIKYCLLTDQSKINLF